MTDAKRVVDHIKFALIDIYDCCFGYLFHSHEMGAIFHRHL